MKGFLSFHQLISDKRFIVSIIASMAAAVAIGSGAAYFIESRKINITPIAALVSINESPNEGGSSIPISHLASIANTASIIYAPSRNIIFSGYVINVSELCKSSLFKPKSDALFLVKTSANYVAGTGNLDGRTCDMAEHRPNSQELFVAVDQQVGHISPERRFFSYNPF